MLRLGDGTADQAVFEFATGTSSDLLWESMLGKRRKTKDLHNGKRRLEEE